MALKPPEVPHLAGRDAALRALGFRDYEAAWLTLVCLHSGVFTRTQFTEHHRCSTATTHAFAQRLMAAGVAREHPLPGIDTRLRYTHVYSRRLYRALGIENLRHRRNPKENVVLFRRLLSFDHVFRHPRLPWLATEAEKLAHFEARGIHRYQLPNRIYGGAAKRTRSYFALKLPIAADDRSATFVYADPGRRTDRELQRWAAEHDPLWARLRAAGTKVRVAVVARTVAKQQALSRKVAAWLHTPSPVQPLSPEEWKTLVAAYADLVLAATTGKPRCCQRWGGFNPCRRLVISLRKRADLEDADGVLGARIDGYSTHRARGLALRALAGSPGRTRIRTTRKERQHPLFSVTAFGCPLLRTPPACP